MTSPGKNTTPPEGPETVGASLSERRRDARLKQGALRSSVGPVIDLSRGGMKVRSSRRLRGEMDVVIFNPSGPHLQLRARVVWTERLGFRRHLAGLQFIDPPEKVARALVEIGTNSFDDE